jgi:glucosamine 6-phosphate synthetase-like amidotransferase/phosphosugar isomerase protein
VLTLLALYMGRLRHLSFPAGKRIISHLREMPEIIRKALTCHEADREIARVADDVIYVPQVEDYLQPLVSVIPLQLLAYHVALLRGCNVDRPRNLAKSVTVE